MNRKTLWNADLQVGSVLLDNQHKVLFDLIKDTRIAISSRAGIRVIDALLGVLFNYSFHHFNSEEEYLKNHPDYYRHCLAHYELIKRTNNYIYNIRNNRLSGEQASANYLDDLWINHIAQFDKPFLNENAAATHLLDLTLDIDDFDYNDGQERRRHQRIANSQVVDGKILADCYNATRLLRRKANIIDMSPGGLKLQSSGDHMVDDLLIITCNIGKNFQMNEKVKVISAEKHTYGVEFLVPAEETLKFFQELYGSVFLNRATTA